MKGGGNCCAHNLGFRSKEVKLQLTGEGTGDPVGSSQLIKIKCMYSTSGSKQESIDAVWLICPEIFFYLVLDSFEPNVKMIHRRDVPAYEKLSG